MSRTITTTLKTLAKNADSFVVGTDYDIEGEVIAFNILRFICNVSDAKRMKYSTLTKAELERSYDKASPPYPNAASQMPALQGTSSTIISE